MSRITVFSLFSGADLVGEFGTRQEAECALDEAVAADPSAGAELASIEFDENSEPSESRSHARPLKTRTRGSG